MATTSSKQDGCTSECLSQNELGSLLSGELDTASESRSARHLDSCRQCQSALEQRAGDASWWEDAGTFLSGDQESTSKSTERRGSPADIESWLGPSDDPASLGRIGQYEVCGIVGYGSTAVVLKVRDPRLHRYVAIKVLAPSLAHNAAARQRFAREARSAAAVTHEHVVPIYGVDEYQGLPYFVMQYVPGSSLAQRLDQQGALQPIAVVRIGLQTARALAAAHEQGLIHRDIKPANILMENGIERVMVTDFGLARVADDAALTRSGVIAGTPEFMSPEQARGEVLDARSDLFCLGAMMYAICTARPPFRAPSVFGVLKKTCEATPHPIRELNPEIPEWLDAFIQKLLSKRPEDRFAAADEVAHVLAAELAFLQNPTSSPSPARPWMKPPRTHWPKLTRNLFKVGAVATALGAVILWAGLPMRSDQDKTRQTGAPSSGSPMATAAHTAPEYEWAAGEDPLYDLRAALWRLEAVLYMEADPSIVDTWPVEAAMLRHRLGEIEQQQQSAQAF